MANAHSVLEAIRRLGGVGPMIGILSKPPDQITRADIASLVTSRVPEGDGIKGLLPTEANHCWQRVIVRGSRRGTQFGRMYPGRR